MNIVPSELLQVNKISCNLIQFGPNIEYPEYKGVKFTLGPYSRKCPAALQYKKIIAGCTFANFFPFLHFLHLLPIFVPLCIIAQSADCCHALTMLNIQISWAKAQSIEGMTKIGGVNQYTWEYSEGDLKGNFWFSLISRICLSQSKI